MERMLPFVLLRRYYGRKDTLQCKNTETQIFIQAYKRRICANFPKEFATKIRSIGKENAYADESGREYTLEWCKKYRELCLENYDLNMKYFQSLDKDEFDHELTSFLSKHNRFKQIFDLNDVDEVYGYYIMVLDEYKQVYIGKSLDIKCRIRQHWNKTKPLDRTLLPMYNVSGSTFSIDFFRPLDTTRIYVWKKKVSDGIEARLVKDFPSKFLCNRIGGDIETAIEAAATMNTRDLQK